MTSMPLNKQRKAFAVPSTSQVCFTSLWHSLLIYLSLHLNDIAYQGNDLCGEVTCLCDPLQVYHWKERRDKETTGIRDKDIN